MRAAVAQRRRLAVEQNHLPVRWMDPEADKENADKGLPNVPACQRTCPWAFASRLASWQFFAFFAVRRRDVDIQRAQWTGAGVPDLVRVAALDQQERALA